jgi:hypothetical protein
MAVGIWKTDQYCRWVWYLYSTENDFKSAPSPYSDPVRSASTTYCTVRTAGHDRSNIAQQAMISLETLGNESAVNNTRQKTHGDLHNKSTEGTTIITKI